MSLENLKRGVTWGAYFALAYSLIAGMIAVYRGSAPFESAGTTLPKVLAVYWGGGLLTGVVLGVLWPPGRSKAGAAVLGAVASIPVSCAVLLATEPPSSWAREFLTYIVIGLALGPLFGLALKLPLRR